MTYCFRCSVCASSFEASDREARHCGVLSSRDYKAEAAAPQTLQLKREREAGGRTAIRDMFLPSAKDFQSPSDPDGQKGIRQWNDEHGPRASNKNPLRPETARKVF